MSVWSFPNLETLKDAAKALTDAVILAPTWGGMDNGKPWVQPSVKPPKKTISQFGVEIDQPPTEGEKFDSWLHFLPLEPQQVPLPTPITTILFKVLSHRLPSLAEEMRRLGSVKQTFCWLRGGDVLLKVVNPPYYSILKNGGLCEVKPGVWVAEGWKHPLVERIPAPEGILLLSETSWETVPPGPFQDAHELTFPMPDVEAGHEEGKSGTKVLAPLRLIPCEPKSHPEFWVLTEDATAQLYSLLRLIDDHVVNQLTCAQSGDTIVLRSRSRDLPPILTLKGQSFLPLQRLTNVYIPRGTELQPALRRDAVRALFGEDQDHVTWLWPTGNGGFVPQSLPVAAFKPLQDRLEYTVDARPVVLSAWQEEKRFTMQKWAVKGEVVEAPPVEEPVKPKKVRQEAPQVQEAPKLAPKAKKVSVPDDYHLKQVKPNELQEKLKALEKQFLDMDAAPDDKDRQALWPEMGSLNAALSKTADAAACWMNALWENEAPPPEWANRWHQSETKGADLKTLLANPDPPTSEVRSVIAHLVAAPEQARPMLAQLRHYLEKHEGRVGVRAVWLAWTTLTRLSHGDVLGLARARDRLLERLLASGMNPEHELPTFLRYHGQQSGDRYRAVHDQLAQLRKLSHQWITTNQDASNKDAHTKTYADLVFAFGLARVGEANECRNIQTKAGELLVKSKDEVHRFLLDAYTYRIQQVLDGKPHTGALPAPMLDALAKMDRFPLYKIDRLRRHSRILEPQEKIDPYRRWYAPTDDLTKELVALANVNDRAEVVSRLNALFKKAEKEKANTYQLTASALTLAARTGEEFAVHMLERFGVAFDALPKVGQQRDLQERAEHLERALFLAAHFDRAEHVQAMVQRFIKLLESQKGDNAAQALDSLAGQCLRGLRKVGMKDEIDQLMQQMASTVLQGSTPAELRKKAGSQWPQALRTLLQIAGGWLYFGQNEKAQPILAEAGPLLFDGDLLAPDRTKMACTYAATLGQAPADVGLPKLMEVFQKLSKINDTYTTNTHYSLSQLQVIEAVVLAVVSDDFNLNQSVRRWLDEDEYLVRRRIHKDVRVLMLQQGV